MKRIVRICITLFLSTVAFSVIAQNEDRSALHDVVERNTYRDNWFISLNGNANVLFAEEDGYVSILDRLKFGGAFTFGKWFNENFGARIQVTGGQLRGFNDIASHGGYYVHSQFEKEPYPLGGVPNSDPNDPDYNANYPYHTNKNGVVGFWQDFNYGSATFDVMANFTNLLRGRYREHNPVDFIPFVGLGWIQAFNNHVTTPTFEFLVVKVGMRINFNVSNNVAVFLEAQANGTDREMDGYVGDALVDCFANAGLGIQYTFNKRFSSMSNVIQLTADEIDRLNKKINDNRYLIENHQDIIERQQDLLDRLEQNSDGNQSSSGTQSIGTQSSGNQQSNTQQSSGGGRQVITQQIVETSCLPEYIRFSLDSYKIEAVEQRKIAEVADYLTKNSDSKLVIVGYADRKTGNPSYNLKLSQKRVEGVASELKRLGINPNRLVTEWRGDKEQPFLPNEWNRVVVMVDRK